MRVKFEKVCQFLFCLYITMLYKYGFFFRFKMKVGGDIEDDIKRASTIRKIIGYDNDLVWEITQMSTVVNIH